MTKKTKQKRRAGKGSVVLLAMMFFGSAGLRIALGTNSAFAETGEAATDLKAVSDSKESMPASLGDAEISKLLTSLRKREDRVKDLELQLDIRAKSLDVAHAEIERRIVALEDMEQRLRSTLAQADSAAENDIARLTSVYENMKPADAAELFQAMEPAFAAGFLARMRPDSAAAVMAGLDPKTAYTISVLLAGRNAKVPKS